MWIKPKIPKRKLRIRRRSKRSYFRNKKRKNNAICRSNLYDGVLSKKDEIAIASFEEPIITKIRVLEEILPVSNKFKPV